MQVTAFKQPAPFDYSCCHIISASIQIPFVASHFNQILLQNGNAAQNGNFVRPGLSVSLSFAPAHRVLSFISAAPRDTTGHFNSEIPDKASDIKKPAKGKECHGCIGHVIGNSKGTALFNSILTPYSYWGNSTVWSWKRVITLFILFVCSSCHLKDIATREDQARPKFLQISSECYTAFLWKRLCDIFSSLVCANNTQSWHITTYKKENLFGKLTLPNTKR